jgi:hypothetical protein
MSRAVPGNEEAIIITFRAITLHESHFIEYNRWSPARPSTQTHYVQYNPNASSHECLDTLTHNQHLTDQSSASN